MTALLLLSLALAVEAPPLEPTRVTHPARYSEAAEMDAALLEIYARYRIPFGTTVYGAMSYFTCEADWRQFMEEVRAVYCRYTLCRP